MLVVFLITGVFILLGILYIFHLKREIRRIIEWIEHNEHIYSVNVWIQNYANKKTYLYIQEKLEEYSNKQKCEEIETLQKIFIRSLEYEYLFWDMCYRQTYNF